MTQVYVRIWDHSVCAILWGGAILCRSSTDLMRYFCPLSESFVKILPSLVQKEWILRSRLAQVSSWMMPCRYRVRSSVMKTSEFFSFRFAEKICCFVFQFWNRHIICDLPLLFGFPIGCDLKMSSSTSWMPSLSLQISMMTLSVLDCLFWRWQLWNLKDVLLLYCSSSSRDSSSLHIWCWRSWLDLSASLSWSVRELIRSFCFVINSDWLWIVSVRVLNAHSTACCNVGFMASASTGTSCVTIGFGS